MPLPTLGPALSFLTNGTVTLTVPWGAAVGAVSPGFPGAGAQTSTPAVPNAGQTLAGTATFTFPTMQAWREVVDVAERLARAGLATVT